MDNYISDEVENENKIKEKSEPVRAITKNFDFYCVTQVRNTRKKYV